MVMVTVDIPNELNKEIEHFKVDNELKDKREAIVMLLRQCASWKKGESMEELFKEVDKMKSVKLPSKEIVRMKRGVYAQ